MGIDIVFRGWFRVAHVDRIAVEKRKKTPKYKLYFFIIYLKFRRHNPAATPVAGIYQGTVDRPLLDFKRFVGTFNIVWKKRMEMATSRGDEVSKDGDVICRWF